MKLPSSLLLLLSTTASLSLLPSLSLASALPPAHANELEARSPLPAPAPAPAPAPGPLALPLPLPGNAPEGAQLEARQRPGGGGGGGGGRPGPVRPFPGTPARDFRPDGSGRGYAVDWRGQGAPTWAEVGWQWFGRELRWGPPRGWRVPSSRWEAPIEFVEKWSEFTWWAPSDPWKTFWRTRWPLEWYTFPLPTDNWGGFRPRPTYTCPARVTVTVRPRPRDD
ncbi:hypothetical protein JCM6882_003992 [Rhodosporidiobolus microsporus]